MQTISKLFSTLLLAGSLVLMSGWYAQTHLTMDPESRIWIEGTSSMHDWECEVGQFIGSLETSITDEALEGVSGGKVVVPSEQIECNNGTMNKKARGALNAKNYPQIRFAMERAEVLSASEEGRLQVKATGQLTLAGTEKTIELTAEGERTSEGRYRFTGSTPLVMSDYGIKPPTAMLGALKTGDEVTVHFDIVAGPGSSAAR